MQTKQIVTQQMGDQLLFRVLEMQHTHAPTTVEPYDPLCLYIAFQYQFLLFRCDAMLCDE